MTEALAVDELVPARHHQWAALPDDRTGKNPQYTSKDGALGALAVFLTPSPSVLASQRTLPQAKGRSKAERLVGLAALPGDHQLRRLLDPVAPAQRVPVFAEGDAALAGAGHGSAFRSFAGQRLIALDGPESCSSPEMQGAHCSQRTHTNGRVTDAHHAITPVSGAPGTPAGIT